MRQCWYRGFSWGGFSAAVVLLASAAFSGTTVSVPDRTAHPGRPVSIPISLETDAELVGAQFDIRFDAERFLASTVTAAEGLPGEIRVKSSQLAPGHWRLALYGTGLNFLPSGQVAQLNLVVPENAPLVPSRIRLEGLLLGGTASPVAVAGGVLEGGTLSVAPLPAAVYLSGRVRYYRGDRPVPSVNVKVRGGTSVDGFGDTDGSFEVRVPAEVQLLLSMEKPADLQPNRGVTALDLLLTRRHILGLEPLDSPWKRLAADVNRQGDINVVDLLLMRRVILGLADRYVAGQPVFRFLPAATVFPAFAQPWNARDFIEHAAPTENLSGQDFVGVKLGDVDGDWGSDGFEPSLSGVPLAGGLRKHSRRQEEPVTLSVGFDRRGGAEDNLSAVVRVAGGFRAITALQFTICWSPAELAFHDVSAFGLPAVSENHFGSRLTERGRLSFVWSDASLKGTSLEPQEPLLSLHFRRLAAEVKTPIQFSAEPTPMLAARGSSPVKVFPLHRREDGTAAPEIAFDFAAAGGHSKILLTTWSEVGTHYHFEYADQLPAETWTRIHKQPGRDGWIRFEDSPPRNRSRFYRIRTEASLMKAGRGP